MLEVRKSSIGNIIILDVIGRVDAMNCSMLQDAIDHALAEDGVGDLLLRVADVNYLSAAGLRVLRILKRQTNVVRLVEPSDRVVEVMQMTGLDAVYEMYSTLNAALEQSNQ